MKRKTKIVCTIGPKSRKKSTLEKMIESGMDAARLNFSYGSYQWHQKAIELIRGQSQKYIGIIQDLQGPRIRIGENVSRTVKKGEEIKISPDDIPISPTGVLTGMNRGDRILIRDGKIELKITAIQGNELTCTVKIGGKIASQNNVIFPDSQLHLPSLTEKDKKDLHWGLNHGIDYVALSFVREVKDIREARKIINNHSERAHIIAKIETREAITNLEEIVKASDGIMVARGDLGVQFPVVKVPSLQRRIITKANLYAKPVIVATQMLSSMIDQPNPTRAEIQDISSAVLSGTDAVMLSEETAIGKYPIEAIKVMGEAAKESEPDLPHETLMEEERIRKESIYGAIAHSACRIASSLDEALTIICETASGATAKRVSKFRPREKVIALTPSKKTACLLSIVWGAFPTLMEKSESINQMITRTDEVLKKKGEVKEGDLTVLTAGFPFGIGKKTNFIKVHRIK